MPRDPGRRCRGIKAGRQGHRCRDPVNLERCELSSARRHPIEDWPVPRSFKNFQQYWLSALFSTGGQATVILRRAPLFSADSQARVPPVVLRSQERITLVICFRGTLKERLTMLYLLCGVLRRDSRCLGFCLDSVGFHSQLRGASVGFQDVR
jgi:hypothetical protein